MLSCQHSSFVPKLDSPLPHTLSVAPSGLSDISWTPLPQTLEHRASMLPAGAAPYAVPAAKRYSLVLLCRHEQGAVAAVLSRHLSLL